MAGSGFCRECGRPVAICEGAAETLTDNSRGAPLASGYDGRVLRVRRSELEAFLANGPSPGTPAGMSPEELADRRFRQHQTAGHERRSSAHGRLPGGVP